MTYVIRMGSAYRMMSEQDIEICEKLPAKNSNSLWIAYPSNCF